MLRSAASCLLATKGGGPETLPAFTWRLLASSLLREGFTLQCSPQASGPTGVPRPQSISSPQHIQSLPSSLLDLGPHNGHLSITTHISTHPHLSNSSTGCAPSTIPVHPSDHWGGTLSRGSHRCSNSNSNIYSTAAGPSRTMSTAASTSSIQSSSNTLPASMGTSSSTKPSSTSTSKRSRAPLPILQPPHHITVSAFPPLNRVGPLTVQYPFPVEYHADREIIVRSLARASIPQGVEQLPGSVFNVPVRLDLLHRVVRWLRAAWQQGTHKAKRRGEVRGGGRKPWPQKGTGRARQGSNRSPLFRKGGVALGPRPRSHAHALPLNIQIQGYKCALSAKANEGRLVLVNSLQPEPVSSLPGMVPGAVVGSSSSSSSSSAGPNSATTGRGKIVGGLLKGGKGAPVVKTKATLAQLQALLQGTAPYRSALLVDSGPVAADGGEALRKGARNLPWVTIMPWYEITVYDILKHGALVMTTSAASQLTQRLLRPALSPYQACRPVRLEWWRRQQVALGQALSQLRQAAAVQNNHGYQGQRRRRWLTA